MATKSMHHRPNTPLQTEQKIALGLLVFLGFGGIIFGFRSFGSHLYRPIQTQLAKYYTGQDVTRLTEPDAESVETLKKTDSDSDGLSDYDEMHVYGTSPYLKDSDSDGVDDKTEVFGGTDPNCPAGKDCASSSATVSAGETTSTIGVTDEMVAGATTGIGQNGTAPDVLSILEAATPEQIRAALLAAGMNKAELDTLSDEDIVALYREALSQAAAGGTLPTSVSLPQSASSSTP